MIKNSRTNRGLQHTTMLITLERQQPEAVWFAFM